MTQATGPTTGTVIDGRYEVLGELAGDRSGASYAVRHALLGSTLALTVLPERLTGDPEHLRRIQDAVRVACQLRHDNLAPLLDLGCEGSRYHVVEALSPGTSLADLLRQGPLAPADALHVVRQLADGLAHAHARGIVHGAVSPARIAVEQGAPPRALLSGLVTAALAWSAPAAPAALLPWATPERLRGETIDARTDVFALGLLLYEILEARPLLPAGEADIRDLLLGDGPPLRPQFSRLAPAGVAPLVARALRRSPAERQQTMAQLREEIEACLRRLGQRSAVAARTVPAVGTAPVVRCVARVVDESVRETGDTETDGAVASERPTVVHRVSVRDTSESRPPAARAVAAPARRVGPTPAGRVGRKGLAATVLVAGVLVALGRPLLRAPEAPPAAAPERHVPARAVVAADAVGRPVPAAAEVEPEPAECAAPPEVAVEPAVEPAPLPDLTAPPPRRMAPRIVAHRPSERATLGVMEGASIDFGVRATDRNPGDRLGHAWFLDGRRVARGASWRFVAPAGSSGATHTVEVEVTDATGLRAPRVTWNVEVTPRMTEAHVRDWLGRLVAAWERKDLATLRLYGIVTSGAEEAAARARLPLFGRYRVVVENAAIHTDGRWASVAFDLVELDRRGRPRASYREFYELERRPGGFVGLRARAG
jgi:serine/threonine-protein kinase